MHTINTDVENFKNLHLAHISNKFRDDINTNYFNSENQIIDIKFIELQVIPMSLLRKEKRGKRSEYLRVHI